jgi:hypothetical protein
MGRQIGVTDAFGVRHLSLSDFKEKQWAELTTNQNALTALSRPIRRRDNYIVPILAAKSALIA